MTSENENPLDPPEGAAPATGSARTAEDLTCQVCGRKFSHHIALINHRKKHEREAEEGGLPKADIPVKRAAKPSQRELAEVQGELASNIKTVGELLHGALINLKLFKLQNPEGRFAIPGTKVDVPIPSFDTHLPYTLISRSQKTAEVLVRHASENETLLKWLVRFNSWFKGGEVGQLVGAHVVAAAQSVGIQNPIVETVSGAMIGDVLEQVRMENYQLRQQLQQVMQQQQVPAGVRPGDERGAGN